MPTVLQDLKHQLYAKQNLIAHIYEEAKRGDGDWDFTRCTEFEHLVEGRDKQEATQECIKMLQELETECAGLEDQVVTKEKLAENEEKARERIERRNKLAGQHTHPSGAGDGQKPVFKSLGTMVKDAWPQDTIEGNKGRQVYLDREFKHFELKALMETGAGWAPESTRIPRIAEFAHRPIQVTDLFPIGNTTQPVIKYMEETTSTNAAVEIGEAAAYPEATLVFTERTQLIRKVAVHIRVTDEQLADVEQVASLIDARLRFFVQQRLDTQLMAGDGLGDNILGVLNTANVQTQAKGADETVDAVYKALTKVRHTGQANPSAVVIHPNDFQPVRLMKANGLYVWGPPSEVGPMRMFGVPVVETTAIAENTAATGDFTNHAQLWMRMGVEILAGFVNDDFINGKQAIRATLRGALVLYRPAAFCLITGV